MFYLTIYNKDMKKSISSIDISRFILAYFVLIIHFRPFLDVSEMSDLLISHGLARIAVPFYLMSAGYFLHFDRIFESIKHYIKLYLKWSLAYAPIVLFVYFTNETTWLEDFFIFIREFFFQGTVIHLWYLPHSALALYLFYFLQKKFSIKQILSLSFVLYSIGVFADAYSGWISPNTFLYTLQQNYLEFFITSRNGVFFALFFISFGVYMKDAQKLSLKTSLISFLLSLVLMFVELVYIIYPKHPIDYNFYFSLIIVMYFLYQLVLNIHIKERTVYPHLRKMASNIYFSHMLIFYLVMFGLGEAAYHTSHLQRFLIAVIGSTLICGIIEAIKGHKYKNKH